jgi:hypothetical protein
MRSLALRLFGGIPQLQDGEGLGQADFGVGRLEGLLGMSAAHPDNPHLGKGGLEEPTQLDAVEPRHIGVGDDDVIAVDLLQARASMPSWAVSTR